MEDRTIAIIGVGNMGEALIRGLLAAGGVSPTSIIATDVRPDRLLFVSRSFGVEASQDNLAAVSRADVVLLAVKPQHIASAINSFRAAVTPEKLVISIAAGVTTERIEREIGGGVRVVRAMPNTPAQVGVAATVLSRGARATDEDLASAEAILGAVGITIRADEQLLDPVTGLSGSGPAYVFLIAEAMIRGGVAAGLRPDVARKLTVQTLLGAAKLLAQSGEEPEQLRRKVTSPGGTTEAALTVMMEGRLPETIIDAVLAATRRSRELSGDS